MTCWALTHPHAHVCMASTRTCTVSAVVGGACGQTDSIRLTQVAWKKHSGCQRFVSLVQLLGYRLHRLFFFRDFYLFLFFKKTHQYLTFYCALWIPPAIFWAFFLSEIKSEIPSFYSTNCRKQNFPSVSSSTVLTQHLRLLTKHPHQSCHGNWVIQLASAGKYPAVLLFLLSLFLSHRMCRLVFLLRDAETEEFPCEFWQTAPHFLLLFLVSGWVVCLFCCFKGETGRPGRTQKKKPATKCWCWLSSRPVGLESSCCVSHFWRGNLCNNTAFMQSRPLMTSCHMMKPSKTFKWFFLLHHYNF